MKQHPEFTSRRFPRLLLAGAILWVAGCASTGRVAPSAGQQPSPVSRAPAEAPAPVERRSRYQEAEVAAYRPPAQPAHTRPQTARAVESLLRRARQQESVGAFTEAAATLERALRIEPRNARLWNRLAHVRFRQGRYDQAASLAAKSKALAPADEALRADNEQLIRRARASR